MRLWKSTRPYNHHITRFWMDGISTVEESPNSERSRVYFLPTLMEGRERRKSARKPWKERNLRNWNSLYDILVDKGRGNSVMTAGVEQSIASLISSPLFNNLSISKILRRNGSNVLWLYALPSYSLNVPRLGYTRRDNSNVPSPSSTKEDGDTFREDLLATREDRAEIVRQSIISLRSRTLDRTSGSYCWTRYSLHDCGQCLHEIGWWYEWEPPD